jgi:hypothetical protein
MSQLHGSDVARDWKPFADLVQIRAVGQFGTGLLIGRGLVLTALHCVCDPANGWRRREGLEVHLFRYLFQKSVMPFGAEVVWPQLKDLGDHPPDIAVLQIKADDPSADDPPTALVEHVFGELPLVPTNGSARGFPKSAAGPELLDGRVEHEQPGRVHYTSLTRRSLTIDLIGPHKLEGRERWKGLSGGPLLANGLIVGVMREVRDAWKGEAIEAEPLAPLLRNDEILRNRLGVGLPLVDPSDPGQTTLLKAYEVIGTATPHLAAYSTRRRLRHSMGELPTSTRSNKQ